MSKLEDDVQKLRDYADADGEIALDFEGSEQEVDEALIGAPVGDHFVTIGEHGSGSLMCFWRADEKAPLEKAPIVWLDSEGSPQGVIASTFEEFLSLLPYNTGFIYDLCRDAEDGRDEERDAAAALTEAGEQNAGHARFVEWLEKDFHVTPAADPAALVRAAASAHPEALRLAREASIDS